jgi:regulator of sigma E protease
MFSGKDFTPAIINEVQKDSPAEVAGMKKNDIILEIDNNKINSILEVSKLITMSTSEYIIFKVSRIDDEILLRVKPNLVAGEDNLGNKVNRRIVGIKLSPYNNEINHIKLGPAQALYHSFNEVYFVTTSSLKYLGSMLLGSGDTSQLGGPIRIAKITGQVAEFGIIPFLSIMAYISISLGLINLFPIPLLDGGHLMFYGFEKLLGRPLSQKTQEGFFRIGMFLLISLMFFATFNDLKDLGLF